VFLKNKLELTPAQVTMISFVALSFLGALFLMAPFSNTNGQWLNFVDAFFMSVSATCVTGLAVVHLGHDFTLCGQLVILFLMQIGGLSYMTITTILVYMAGKKLSISDSKIFDMSNNSEAKFDFKDFVIKIALLTFLIEGVGVLCLSFDSIKIVMANYANYSDLQAFAVGIFQAVFHSVSAFCNAGLSLFESSLETHSANYWLLFMFSILPIIGGLGYTVLTEISAWFDTTAKRKTLSLHTKVSLLVTFSLLIIGVLVQFALIYIQGLTQTVHNSVADPSLVNPHVHNLWTAFFQSVAARSSGFNSIPLTELGDSSLVLLIVWMFIGACPGGTGGGIKVTTLILVFSIMYAGLKNTKDVKILNRSVGALYQQRALIVFISTIVLIMFFTFLNVIFENQQNIRFIDHLFEVTSAFTTVGLSTGITSQLSDPSLIVLCISMIIGRPGPLLFLMAIFTEETTREIRYAEENILIG
jgi:trk system potassium uptake protein TrkH